MPSWGEMSSDVMELVFTKLPESSVLMSSSVCKSWNAVVQDSSFVETYARNQVGDNRVGPFYFEIDGRKYSLRNQGASFSLQFVDKHEGCRSILPTLHLSSPQGGLQIDSQIGAGGILFAIVDLENGRQVLYYKFGLLEKEWKCTSPMLQRTNRGSLPLIVAVVRNGNAGNHIVVSASQIDDDEGLGVQIYNCRTDSWEIGEELPYEFLDSNYAMAVVHQGRIFAYDQYMGFLSELDIDKKQWSAVKMMGLSTKLRRSCLFSQANGLFLVTIEDMNEVDMTCNVWRINESTHLELLYIELIQDARPARLSQDVSGFLEHSLWMGLDFLYFVAFLGVLHLAILVECGHKTAIRSRHRFVQVYFQFRQYLTQIFRVDEQDDQVNTKATCWAKFAKLLSF